jgi:hypothetical protein
VTGAILSRICGQCQPETVSLWNYFRLHSADGLPTVQCAFPSHHMILNVTFNVTFDLMIFLIPLPLFFRSNLPWKRKLLLILPFTMGVFTIFAAIICKAEALYLLSNEWWVVWCLREASMGVIVANVPYSWGLLRQWTSAGSFLMASSGKSPAYSSQSSQTSSKHSLLRAAKNSLSFGSSRKQSIVSRGTGENSALHRPYSLDGLVGLVGHALMPNVV